MSNENNQRSTQYRRASDTYVPLSLVVHGIATIGALFGIWATISTAITNQEKRMTTLEIRMERLDEISSKLASLEQKCYFQDASSNHP